MGFRFQKRLSILPGVRINLSKSGASTSLGPRGADVNIGRDGVTTNAGIPGTGLSYRQKLDGASARAGATIKKGGKGGLLCIPAVVGGLGLWAFQHAQKIEKAVGSVTGSLSQTASPAAASPAGPVLRYVHRDGSVLRDEPKASGLTLKKESKGQRSPWSRKATVGPP